MAHKSIHTGQQIDDAISVVIAKESTWDNKQDQLVGSEGQVVGFDENGTPVAQDAPETGVVSFNGRTGEVTPQDGDYTAEMVGALPSSTIIPSKVSELANDSGYLTEYVETDPTVPAWAKEATKPSYTADEVGALPSTTTIPSKTSDLTNDSGYLTESEVDEKVAAVVNSAPETLNTLDELAQALGDDPNFATTVATQIGNKVDKVDGKQLSTNDFTDEYKDKVDNALQSYTETDPTVPDWAKSETKPGYDASEVAYDNATTGMTASDVQSAVDELFTSVSNGKTTVASAITDKGVTTADDATFDTMAANIALIETSVEPEISINSSTGLITATANDKSSTLQLDTHSSGTVTPTTASQVISGGKYLTGDITVAGDADLIASNIKSDVEIFGVAGSYKGSDVVVTRVEDFTFSYDSSSYVITITIPIGTQISKVVFLNGYVMGSSLRNGFVYPDYYYSTDTTPSFLIPFAMDGTFSGLTLSNTLHTITTNGTNIVITLSIGKAHPYITTNMSSGRFTVGYIPA